MAQETMAAGAAGDVTWRETFGRIPMVWKVAAVLGVLGWWFSLGGSTTTTINGVTDCDGLDIGPLVVAGVVAVLGVVGFQRVRRELGPRRLSSRATWAGMAVLAAIVAVHVLRVVLAPAGQTC